MIKKKASHHAGQAGHGGELFCHVRGFDEGHGKFKKVFLRALRALRALRVLRGEGSGEGVGDGFGRVKPK